MHFKLAALSALWAVANGQMSAQQVVQNIDQITDLSSQTNDIANSISVTNFFTTAPQLVSNFGQIINIASNDVTAMGGSSGSKAKRQDCLNLEGVENCIEDIEGIVGDPGELLGGNKRSIRSSRVRRQAAPPYDPNNQDAICSAFREFVQVHQQLLSTVIGKHGVLSLTPYTQQIAQVLETLESGVDALAFGIIDTVPTCAQDATANKNSLDQKLGDAIDTYRD